MRIIYPDPNCVPDKTPAALQILQNVQAIAQLGHQVELLTPKSRNGLAPQDVLGQPLLPGVKAHALPDFRRRWYFPTSSNRLFYFQAKRWLRRQRDCVVLVRNLKLAEHLLKTPGMPPLFFETHEIFAQSFRETHASMTKSVARKASMIAQREEFVYRHCKGIIAITRHLAEDLVSQYNIKTPIHVAPDGVDMELAERAISLNKNAVPILLYLGSLHPWKGVDTLIRMMQYVDVAKLRVVGGTHDRIAELRQLASQLGVDDRIEWLGPVDPVKRFEVIAAADICLIPSSETSIGARFTSPLKLFEYMALGKPIVASDLPSMREVLKDGESALLTTCGDGKRYADAVNLLLAEPALQNRLGMNAKALCSQYTWKVRARGMLAFIERVVGRS